MRVKSWKIGLLCLLPWLMGADNLGPKDPEYYLPLGEYVATYRVLMGDSSYLEQYLLSRKGNTFILIDDLNHKEYFALQEGSLYYTDADGGDRVVCLKYPLRKGKTWRESNSIPVQVLGRNETVDLGSHMFGGCLKLLKSFPQDIVESEPDEEEQILKIYAPGRWLVAELTYPGYRTKRVQIDIEKYAGQFKTYKSFQEKMSSRRSKPDNANSGK